MKILVVDDSPIVTKMMSKYLGACGYTVEVANSPFGVSGKIREMEPQVVLMDLGLPGLSGESLLEIMEKGGRKMRPRVVVISAAVKEMQDVVQRGLADDYYEKGNPLHELETKIRGLFRPSVAASYLARD